MATPRLKAAPQHFELDPTSAKAQRAGEMAREMLSARIYGRDRSEPVFARVVRDVGGDTELLANVLVAQTAISGLLLRWLEVELAERGAILARHELLQRLCLSVVVEGITL